MNKAILLILILLSQHLLADGNLTVYFFYSTTCPHCHEESIFLTRLQSQHPSVEIKSFAVDVSSSNKGLWMRFAKAYSVTSTGVPQTYIGDKVVVGYGSYETHGKLIEGIVNACLENGCADSYTNVLKSEGNQTVNTTIIENYLIDYPIIGTIDMRTLSLPVLSVLIGLLDGFNPCAMWVLVYLIMMLTNTRTGRRCFWL